MYYLMNKDSVAAVFSAKPATQFSAGTSFVMNETIGNLPLGFRNINSWLDGRKASKHSSHLQELMKSMGCYDSEGFIRVTHAATINDTFWVKSDRERVTWQQISLYRNQFSETVSKLAFEGIGLYDAVLSSTSPELSCEGSFRKCFKKESGSGEYGSDIFLYKRGHEFGAGREPYCEQMASEIAKIISPQNAVAYELATLHEKLASKCNLFTNEQNGYASFAKIADVREFDFEKIFNFFAEIGSEQQFREMLVIDALCFNQDRHAGNYGVLFNNDTLEIVGMAPVFDLNISLLPYVEKEEFDCIGDKLYTYAPKLGDDFTHIGQIGANDIIRDRLKDICDFSFSFRGDDDFPEERVRKIEEIVRMQAHAILSEARLYTKDVFFSPKAKEAELNKEKALKAEHLMHSFVETIEDVDLGEETFEQFLALLPEHMK